jgi:sugar phosphate isomerase/epimerase
MITRRNFLKAGATVAALAVIPKNMLAQAEKQGKTIGLQLYSVREDIRKDFDTTMKAVVDIGYKSLETYGYKDGKFFGKTPVEMKKYLTGLGAKMTGSHTGSGLLAANDTQGWDFWKKNAEDTAELGCKWIVQAGYPHKDLKSISDVKRLAEQFNTCGEIAKANGLKFAFHNHIDEFHKIQGKVPYDVMIENTDKNLVGFQMDTAQLVYGGYKCHEYVKRYPGRFPNWHLKDANPDGKGSTEFGKGLVDFEALFAVAKEAGLEDYYVEQERYNMTPLESLKYDYEFLLNVHYVKW